MRKYCIILLALALLATGLAGCGREEAGGAAYYAFTDDAGRQITLEKKPEKVAVLFSSYADVWTAAGGSIAVTVGETLERGFAPEGTALVDAGAGKTIDREALVAAGPDFVICSADIAAQRETAEYLNGVGIPCAQFRVDTFEEYRNMLAVCTDITGDKAAFETWGTQVAGRVDAIRSQAREALEGKDVRILFVRAGSQYSATKAKTAEENFVCAMLKELGTYNIGENAPVLLDGLSLEEILVEDPDYIFISTMGNEQAARTYMDSVLAQESWQALTAVKTGHYAYLPKDLFQFKPNGRWDEAYGYLAAILEDLT